jgi:hypothetical protein
MDTLLSRLDLREAGHLPVDRPIEPTARLMLAYRELGLPESDAPLFLKALKAGLMSDLLPEEANPAHLPMPDLLRAAKAAGIGGDRLAAAFDHGPSGRYTWAGQEPRTSAGARDPEPLPYATGKELFTTAAALETRLGKVLPPYDGTSADCVYRLAAARRELYGGSAVSRDDFTVGTRRPEQELAAAMGGDWNPLDGPPESAAPLLKRLGPGATAFMLVSMEKGPGHAFAMRNEGGHLFWLETQEGPGLRVYPVGDDAPSSGGSARVIVTDATGRAVGPDSLPKRPYDVDALRLAPEDPSYAAQGREHELQHVVHGHGETTFRGTEETLVFNRATGVVVETDTTHLWVARGRYFATQRAARASRRGKVRSISVNIVEVVARPERVLPAGEERHYDPEVVRNGIRDANRRLNNAVRLRDGEAGPGFRGTSLRELFGDDPNYEFGPDADDLSILLPPGFDDSVYTHITEGTPLTFTLAFLRATARFADAGDVKRYLQSGLRFGDEAVLTYLDDRLDLRVGRFAGPAMEYVPGVAETRASMTFLNTHAYAAARVFVRGDEHLAKNLIHGTLRTSFAAVRESMPADVRRFLERRDDQLREMLRADIADRLADSIRTYQRHPRRHRRWREAGPRPRPLLEYPLRNQGMTLGDYVDNMLLPRGRPRVYVDQNDAMNVRTNFRRLDHDLIVTEIRDVGPQRQSLARSEQTAETFARIARQVYAQAQRVARNNRTEEGREYNATLAEAVDTVSAYDPPAADLATDVRDLLDSVARQAPDAVRDPIFRGNVTSNLQADAVVALSEFIEDADRDSARTLRHAIAAIRDALRAQSGVNRTVRGQLHNLSGRADRLIRELSRHSDRRYPDPEYINDAGATFTPARPRWRDVRSSAGRDVGRAFFDDADWRLRSPFYGDLPKAEFRSWSGKPGQEASAPVEVPLGDRSRVYVLAGHGSQLGDLPRLATLTAREIVQRGFTTLLLIRCATGTAEPPSAGLRDVARDSGLTIVEETGAVAPTPGEINLLPDTDGRPTGVRVYRPDGTVAHHGADAVHRPIAPSPTATELPVVAQEGETFATALTRALDRDGPADGGYTRFVGELTEENLPESAPLIDESRLVSVEALERAGVVLGSAQKTQAVLQNGRLPVGALGLGRVQRFLLTMEIEPVTLETQAEFVAALAAVRPLGVTVVTGPPVHVEPDAVRPEPIARTVPVGSGAPVSRPASVRPEPGVLVPSPAPVRPPDLVVPESVPLPVAGSAGVPPVAPRPEFYFAEPQGTSPRPGGGHVPRPAPVPRPYREGLSTGVVGTPSEETGFVYWYTL